MSRRKDLKLRLGNLRRQVLKQFADFPDFVCLGVAGLKSGWATQLDMAEPFL